MRIKKITVNDIEEMGSDNVAVFGGTFEGGIHLQQIPDEIVPCVNDIIKSGKVINNFLEIGSAGGGATALFDTLFGLKNIVIVDDNKHPKHIYRKTVIEKIKGTTHEYIGDSRAKEAVYFVDALKLEYDLILIDADHSYEAVKADFENYFPFLQKGGFLILHDIVYDFPGVDNGVKQLVEELKAEYTVTKYISATHPMPCGIGVIRK